MREVIRGLALLSTLLVFGGAFASADEVELTETLLEAPSSIEQQQENQPTLDSKPAQQENNQTLQEPEQPTAPPDELSTEDAIQTPPELADEEPLDEPTPDSNDELHTGDPEAILLSVKVRWIIASPDGLLSWGDEIALLAEIDPDVEGLQLQWQVATKPVEELQEDEEEWMDIPDAQGLKYTLTTEEGMQAWRWRVCMRLPEGDAVVYSNEIMLPSIQASDETEPQVEEEVLGAQDADELPIVHITIVASVPLEEIDNGTQIELIAEIDNTCEDIQLQWQYLPMEMDPVVDAWQDIPDATELTYAYVLDEENAGWLWRLLITVPERNESAEAENEDGIQEDVQDEEAEEADEPYDEPETTME